MIDDRVKKALTIAAIVILPGAWVVYTLIALKTEYTKRKGVSK